MQFQVGDKAVVPAHGVGVIKEVREMNLGTESFTAYVIKILDNGLTFTVPVEKLQANGIREIMTADTIEKVYAVLADREKPADKQTWNRRYREYMNKIKTGEPLEVAAVLRDLAILRSEKSLSFGERKMYDQAHGLIVQEVAVARDVDESFIKDELEKLFKEADEAAAARNPNRKAKPAKRPEDEDDAEDDEEDEDSDF